MTDLELPIGEWQLAIYYGAWTTIVTALPPDVRRWLCPAVGAIYILGYALGPALGQTV